MKKFSKKGLSLPEILIAIVMITLISTASYIAATTLINSAESSRNKSIAVNLLQKSQEELRRVAQAYYDELLSQNGCVFPHNDLSQDANTCGFDNTSDPIAFAEFDGFTRKLVIVEEEDSTELKKAVLTVNWNEFGDSKQLQSTVLLARPPAPLPGNIIGQVKSSNTSTLISGAAVTVGLVNSTVTRTTISSNVLGSNNNANYDFADSETNRFVLPAGVWQLLASHENFIEYTHSGLIAVDSSQETRVNFFMEPKPEDATISGNVVDRYTGQALPNFNRADVNLYDNNINLASKNDVGHFNFEVSFDDSDAKALTLNTHNAFKAGYAFQVNFGGSPSCQYEYNREGWSSAVMQQGGLMCSNPWNGSSNTDQIMVNPGDNITMEIPVEPVPEVLITGKVVDSKGQPISNATIFAKWPRGDSADWRKLGARQTAKSDANGNFTYSVPAVQAMFANTNPNQNYLEVWGRAEVTILSCCNQIVNENRNSQHLFVGPLFPGDAPKTINNLVILTDDKDCGNAQGTVTQKTSFGLPINNAIIHITGPDELTNGNGQYAFVCQDQGFRIVRGNHHLSAKKANYYTYNTQGSSFWYASRPRIFINSNTITQYDLRLWPEGFGTIEVKVKDKGTGNPIQDAMVRLTPYFSSSQELMTDSNGRVVFNNVPETWPPAGLPINDPYYYHNTRRHTLRVSHNSGIYQTVTQSTPELSAGSTIYITIDLVPEGFM